MPTQRGDLWEVDWSANQLELFPASSLSSSHTSTATISGLNGPEDAAFDANGNLWLVNHSNSTVVENAAADVAGAGSLTPTAKVTIRSFDYPRISVFNPPPYNLPLPH